jgi:hypothetical protein
VPCQELADPREAQHRVRDLAADISGLEQNQRYAEAQARTTKERLQKLTVSKAWSGAAGLLVLCGACTSGELACSAVRRTVLPSTS